MDTITAVANMAIEALLYEVALSPKPGLVDRYDNGAHTDMDFFLFIKSIQTLAPFLRCISVRVINIQEVYQNYFRKLEK